MPLISLKQAEGNTCESNSPLLFEVLSRINKEVFYEILDIGPASSSSIEYFNQFHCKIHICDCMQSLCEASSDKLDTTHKLNRFFVQSLGLYKNQKNKINLVLLWDLPNYLQPEILNALIQHLKQHTHQDIIIHAYIHTSRLMPVSPARYNIIDNHHILTQNISVNNKTDCPMYYQDALHKHMHPFRVKRSVLQANGIQEYILSLN